MSEVSHLIAVELVYNPTPNSLIEQLYEPCEPCKLISRQTSTMIYLSKTKQQDCKKVSSKNQKSSFIIFVIQDIIIKTIEKEKIADCQLAIEYAKRESAVLTRLDHPNIIKVYHTAETEGQFMIFMEYAGFGSNYLSKKVLLNQKAVREDKLQCWA